jgi:hypothetical protein
MNLRIFSAVSVLSIFFSGCSLMGDAYQPQPIPPAKSVIYIYQPPALFKFKDSPMVTCGHESIEIEPGGYYSFVEESGPIECAVAGAAKSEIKFDAHSGEEYFIKEVKGSSGATQLMQVRPSIAHEEIANCRKQGIHADSR